MDYTNISNIVNGMGSCQPVQIINFNTPINDASTIDIYDGCGCTYDKSKLLFSYSLDSLCWSCYMSYDKLLENTIDLDQDFFLRAKLQGAIDHVEDDGELYTDYSTQLDSNFSFTDCTNTTSANMFNPYNNLDGAASLYNTLSETVSCIVGIQCYYIKLNPETNSKDLTFKEYTLMNVESIKQVKLVIPENQMPSSKPEFSDWGLDFQTDWEVEVTKGSFATAFGPTAQPMEGDLVYIPLMKRMWMLTGAYEEKNDGFMWQASTFKLQMIKYQEKDSVDLGDAQAFVDSVVKNKYEDLFGEDNSSTLDSGREFVDEPTYAANTLYSVFESDAIRAYVTCDTIEFNNDAIYYRGTLISDSKYIFNEMSLHNNMLSRIVYQNKFCGNAASISFIIKPLLTYTEQDNIILRIGYVYLKLYQDASQCYIHPSFDDSIQLDITPNKYSFVVVRFSKDMNILDMNVYDYTYNPKIPEYKLQPHHYWFDIDNPHSTFVGKFNIELDICEKSNIEVNGFSGEITNIKVFDVYNDNISELLQMYPTHQHLLVNDTARKILDLPGVAPA